MRGYYKPQMQAAAYRGQQNVGGQPIDGNLMPVKMNRNKNAIGAPFGGSGLEEEKYSSVSKKTNTQRTAPRKAVGANAAAKKKVENNFDNIMGQGGSNDVFGKRPVLSSMKKGKAAGTKTGAKPAAKGGSRFKGAPFGGAAPSAADNIPIKRGVKAPAIPEYDEVGPLSQCMYCKRTFNEVSLAKHQRVCLERPGKRKRKVFDSSKMRIVDNEQRALQVMSRKTVPKKNPPGAIPKWKAMSMEFRSGLRAARLAEKGITPPPQKSFPSAGVRTFQKQCPTCKRSFREEAAEKHIPFCANKAKEAAMRAKLQVKGKNNKLARRK